MLASGSDHLYKFPCWAQSYSAGIFSKLGGFLGILFFLFLNAANSQSTSAVPQGWETCAVHQKSGLG